MLFQPCKNKVVILVFSAHKKYSCLLINLGLSHCSNLDYFNDVFNNFSEQEQVSIQLSDFIKNILICVLKMNVGLTGLEQQEGE